MTLEEAKKAIKDVERAQSELNLALEIQEELSDRECVFLQVDNKYFLTPAKYLKDGIGQYVRDSERQLTEKMSLFDT